MSDAWLKLELKSYRRGGNLFKERKNKMNGGKIEDEEKCNLSEGDDTL